MTKIGVIWVGYQCADLMAESLGPWIEARAARLGGNEFVICAVSVPFEGFDHGNDIMDATLPMLHAYCGQKNIDHYITSPTPMKETEARGQALRWLVEQGVDILWQVDSDELYTEDNITRIIATVESNPFMAWWKLSLLNAVFDKNTFLAEPFTPPRIHKVRLNRFVAQGFWADNNVFYRATNDGVEMEDAKWASFTIPANVAAMRHFSWLNDLRSKRKCEYQQRRWGPPVGAGCSFAWDDTRGGLIWNEDYFKRTGQPKPEVIRG